MVADGSLRRRRHPALADDGRDLGHRVRALSLGSPLVVSDVGWFAELPDEVAIKVPVDEREVDALAASSSGCSATTQRGTMGAAALERRRARSTPLERVAEAYAAALEEAAGGEAVPRRRGARGGGGSSRRRPRAPTTAEVERSWRRRRPPGGCRARSSRPRSRRGPGSRASSSSRPLVRYALGRGTVAPWIMVDELVYSELAKSFADAGRFLIRGERDRGVRHRLPGADRTGVGALRLGPAGLRGGEGDQRARHLARGRPGVLPRPPRALAPLAARGGGADRCRAVDALRGDADDRERVLPAVPLCRAGDGPRGSSGRLHAERSSCSASCLVAYLTRAQAVALLPALLTAPLLVGRARLRFRGATRSSTGWQSRRLLGSWSSRSHAAARRSGCFGAYEVAGRADYSVRRWPSGALPRRGARSSRSASSRSPR